MKDIKVKISPKEWAEKRLQFMASSYVQERGRQLKHIDEDITNCGFILEEETQEQPKPTEELPTDNVERVKYFLNQLPDGYRERALKQVAEGFKRELVEDLTQAIYQFNVWDNTNEKHEFWKQVCAHYEKGTPLPQIPSEEEV